MAALKSISIFIAGNAVSSDLQGAYLARTILAVNPDVHLWGSGGDRMKSAGVEVLVRSDHVGCVDAIAAFSLLRETRKVLAEQKRILAGKRPDLAILIDNEGYCNKRLAQFLDRQGIPTIYYFPPLVWLWGSWRAHRIARHAKAIITGFPKDVEIYRKAGGAAVYFGNPLVDILAETTGAGGKIAGLLRAPRAKIVGLMPGSRNHEIELLAPAMLGAAREIQKNHPETGFVLPVAAPHLRSKLEKLIEIAGMSGKITLVEPGSYATLKECTVVIVAAGTATIELALLEVPMVVVYRLGTITYQLARHLIRTDFIAMPNILTNRRIVPELRQSEVTIERLVAETEPFLTSEFRSDQIKADLKRVRQILGEEKVLEKIARFILAEASGTSAGSLASYRLPTLPASALI